MVKGGKHFALPGVQAPPPGFLDEVTNACLQKDFTKALKTLSDANIVRPQPAYSSGSRTPFSSGTQYSYSFTESDFGPIKKESRISVTSQDSKFSQLESIPEAENENENDHK